MCVRPDARSVCSGEHDAAFGVAAASGIALGASRTRAVSHDGPSGPPGFFIGTSARRRSDRSMRSITSKRLVVSARSAPTSITRAAGLALTKVLAGEGAPHNVLVNALLVGFIEADQHVQAAAKAGIALKDYIAARAKEVPLGRIGRAEEFANIACFLASDAGSYITGTAINVDGGRSPVV